MRTTSCRVTIFEGPDGSGKSTAAKKYAAAVGGRYVHCGPMPRVTNVARMYVEAMLPALLGYQHVVMDRCWLSEGPYGAVFREGQDRIGAAGTRMLERIALRCGAGVVLCLPEYEVVKENYLKRKHLEMLENDQQLKSVHTLYMMNRSSLPTVRFDFTKDDLHEVMRELDDLRAPLHNVAAQTAGSWAARTALVGDSFAERKEADPFYQAPFVSFSGEGCSRWLAEQLEEAEVSEAELFWVNADELSKMTNWEPLLGSTVCALGNEAVKALEAHGFSGFTQFPHPQHWKRFHSRSPYPLITKLKETR